MLSEEEGIAIHIVNEVTEGIVLIGSDESDRSQSVHGHLAHASKNVFAAHSDTAAHFIGNKLFFTERTITVRLKQNEVLAVLFK